MRFFLIGYMGSGKTTMGKLVAKKAQLNFVDMDKVIENEQGKIIPDIFTEYGEEYFRHLERDTLEKVSDLEDVIIATGGGVPCFFDNMQYMNRKGITIYIHLTANELTNRLMQTDLIKRPLLANLEAEEMEKFIAENLAKRENFYQQAAYKISGSDDEITAKMLEIIEQNHYCKKE